MSNEILIALVSFAGTLIGTLGGIIASSKLTTFRIESLEEKVDKHNSVIERTFKIEGRIEEMEKDIRDIIAKI